LVFGHDPPLQTIVKIRKLNLTDKQTENRHTGKQKHNLLPLASVIKVNDRNRYKDNDEMTQMLLNYVAVLFASGRYDTIR